MKRPDVWITIGRTGFDEAQIERLLQYGINGIRINTGRSSLDWADFAISKLLSLGFLPHQIYLDIGNQKPRMSLLHNETLTIDYGDRITISNLADGNALALIQNDFFFKQVSVNDRIYLGDGEIECVVAGKDPDFVELEAISAGEITNNIAIGIVGRDLAHFSISPSEVASVNLLLEKYHVSLILSFVETVDNIAWAEAVFPQAHEIIPKIETSAAVRNYDSIIAYSKKIFIGRGDLGLSAGIEKVGILQKRMVQQAHAQDCYVAVGTGTLDSLKWTQVPLRAEIIDITNYCFEKVDSIVLTSETAGSKDPFKAIGYLLKTLDYVCQSD